MVFEHDLEFRQVEKEKKKFNLTSHEVRKFGVKLFDIFGVFFFLFRQKSVCLFQRRGFVLF